MRELFLAVIAVILSLSEGNDDWDTFSNDNWWHSLASWDSRIREANCLLYRNRRPGANVIPEVTEHDPTGIPLARHHIIPGHTLITFFNTALRENGNNNNHLAGLLNILGALADGFMDHYEGNEQISHRVRNQLSNIRITQLHYLTGDEVPMTGLFNANRLARAIFYWMPGNIFIGPRNRADDPGETFDQNANFIINYETAYNILGEINRIMNLYIENRRPEDFNAAIDQLIQLVFHGRREPYPFQIEQWQARYMNAQGLHFYEIIRPNQNTGTTQASAKKKRSLMKRNTTNKPFGNDPLCLRPLVLYELKLKNENLLIAANVLARTENFEGFKKEFTFDSWKQWLEKSTWNNGWLIDGITKDGRNMVNNKYGRLFKDNSFVVGVVGSDLQFGNDSWVNNAWDLKTLGGQIFFDKNSRPVALAVTDEQGINKNEGWLFVYFECGWKLVTDHGKNSITSALSSVFLNGRTESLDSTAMIFKPYKIKSAHDGSDLKKK